MEKSGFFNSVNRDRVYSASDFAAYFASFIGNGVFAKHEQSLFVSEGENMSITLSSGRAFINGWAYQNTSNLSVELDSADGVLDRIDRLVLRWDLQAREIMARLLKGEFASAPTAPAITRNSEIFELALADIYVAKGVIGITQSAITDLRPNTELCGYVAHLLEDYEGESLYAQYTAKFNEFMQSAETTLSGDVAGNLLVRINQNKDKINLLNTIFTFTLKAGAWQEVDGFFVQTVAVQGVTGDVVLEVDLVTSSIKATVEQELEAYAGIVSVVTGMNTVTVKFLEQPAIGLNLQGQVVKVG